MKESYFFSHDYNARQDPKMQEVLMDYGVAGIGIYWCIIEQLYEQGGRLLLSSIKAIAFSLHTNIDDVHSIINNYGLFDNDGLEFWSPSVSRRLESRKQTSEKRTRAASKRWAAKDANSDEFNASASKNDANAMQVHQKNDAKQCYKKEIKEKEIKEKEIKENNNLSLTPSLGDESAAEPQTERDIFLEIFFFRNFRSPVAEVDRFVAHYQANGWCRNGSTRPVKDKAALAKCWEPLDKDCQKFPADFLMKWKSLYDEAKSTNPRSATKLLSDIYKVDISTHELKICASKELKDLIYRNHTFFNSKFFLKFYQDRKILWIQ